MALEEHSASEPEDAASTVSENVDQADKVHVEVADMKEWLDDAQWALEEWLKEEDGAFRGHKEKYAAVYRLAVIGYGDDQNALREQFSKEKGVPFERIIVQEINEEDQI